MTKPYVLGLLTLALLPATTVTADAQDAALVARGKAQFARCQVCHSIAPGPARIGPSLKGIVNRPAGKEPGFRYTPNMAAAKFSWTKEQLDAFLTKPRAVVPGTSMVFAGLPDPASRAAIIAYLATIK
jgi:cytochrome c